jgi:hypothetical protein
VIVALLLVAGIAGLWLLGRRLELKLGLFLAVLPFVTFLRIHAPSRLWPIVPDLLLAAAVLSVAPADRERRRAIEVDGVTIIVFAYVGLALAQAFNPGLPSVTLGLRGARLIAEPALLYFVGAEVARRRSLARTVVTVIIVTGVIVTAYGIWQGLHGFDAREFAFQRRAFPISLRERRVFSTMAGASVFGNYLALVTLLTLALMLARPTARRILGGGFLIVACSYAIVLTGQRGVLIGAGGGLVTAVAVSVARRSTRVAGLYAGIAVCAVAAVIIGLIITTPVQDRRLARAEHTSALAAARIKLGLLKAGGQEASLQLRVTRLRQTRDALETAPLGVGAGLSLTINPGRADTTFLGHTGFSDTYTPAVPPIPNELYYYTVASELGLAGLALFVALLVIAIRAAGRVALRSVDGDRAAIGVAAAGFFVFIAIDSFTVDAMSSIQVAAYAWLLFGMTARWARERVAVPVAPAPATVAA